MNDQLSTTPHLDEAHALYADHPVMHKAIQMLRESQHAATRKAVLEEVKARYYGEGLCSFIDFKAWLAAQLEAR